jgi:hypothetical protein
MLKVIQRFGSITVAIFQVGVLGEGVGNVYADLALSSVP